MEISNNENLMKEKYKSAVNTLGRYFQNTRKANKQAYYLGQKDVISQLADFIWAETNGNPEEISVVRVLEYLEVKQMQLEQGTETITEQNIPNQGFKENNGYCGQNSQYSEISQNTFINQISLGNEGSNRIEEEEHKT